MPHPILHGLRLHGYAPYACGLRSNPTEWIIWQIAHKRKSTNILSYSKQWISFSYHLLSIIHAYNVGTSWLWSHITASDVDLDSNRAAWLDRDIASQLSHLSSDITSMTRQRHHATTKSPRQQHRTTTNIVSATSSPVGLDSAVANRTRWHHH
jgi:hypothetical protein